MTIAHRSLCFIIDSQYRGLKHFTLALSVDLHKKLVLSKMPKSPPDSVSSLDSTVDALIEQQLAGTKCQCNCQYPDLIADNIKT